MTLPSWAVADEGLQVIEGLPDFHSMIFAHVADLDVEGTYPNEEILMNISRATTMMEVVDIEGCTEGLRRAIGVNLSGGPVNAVEICTALYKTPQMDEMLEMFRLEQDQLAA